MTGRIGVAISTTGDEHRLGFLETCVEMWDRALPMGASLFVTVDGDKAACERVQAAVYEWTESVYRVGRRHEYREGVDYPPHTLDDSHRLGVAVNKNTGLELLMSNTEIEHLFLSDDDTWPLYPHSLRKHMDPALPAHSMVCWGQSRLLAEQQHTATWSWPRGVMLYQTRTVVEHVGGMVEAFGPGGHEHAEYSQRIHNAGLTPAPFVTPRSYATRTGKGARMLWHAEDMRQPGEAEGTFVSRKRKTTSIHRRPGDWTKINKIMSSQEGSADFVPYRAHDNGRASATLCADN